MLISSALLGVSFIGSDTWLAAPSGDWWVLPQSSSVSEITECSNSIGPSTTSRPDSWFGGVVPIECKSGSL